MGAEIELIGRIAAATVLAGLIGYEREAADKPAGIRTHIVLAVASCLVAGIGELVIDSSDAGAADPNRALHAVITGVGFLGAGTIIRDRDEHHITGLTTASSLFFVSALGVAAGLGYWLPAVGTTALVLVTLRVLGWVDHRIGDDPAAG